MSGSGVGAPQVEPRLVATSTHGRLLLRRAPTPDVELLLVGFHGYGENASRQIAELVAIPGGERRALLAIEGLHAFYDRRANEVVRSWMTRDLRELAISDNLAYVRQALDQTRRELGWTLPLVLLGFSQGTAMAWRSALLAGHEIAAVIAVGGDLPPELDARGDIPWPDRVLLARGERDEWYTEEKLAADRAALAARGVRPGVLRYAGGHEWTDELRAGLAQFLRGVAGVGEARSI